MVNLMCWVDTETTGLEPTIDSLLEVAFVVTDERLRVVDMLSQTIQPVTRSLQELIALTDPFVVAMHDKSGLWKDLRAGRATSAWAAEAALLEFFHDYFQPGDKPPMCGSSVHFDRAFMKQHLTTLETRFGYRNIDVSTIKELARRWHPKAHDTRPGQEDEDKKHRALDDVLASIDELNHYIDSGFINPLTDPTGE